MLSSVPLSAYLIASQRTRRPLLLWPAWPQHAWDSCTRVLVCKSEGSGENKGQRETDDGSFGEKVDQEA